jgi:hypothetical protein
MGKQLDELAKAMAAGTSRRAALKRFAVGVAGAALASVLPAQGAQAQGVGLTCVQFCEQHGASVSSESCRGVWTRCIECVRAGGTPASSCSTAIESFVCI